MARQIKKIEAGQTPHEAYEEDIAEGNNAREALLFSLNTLFNQVSDRNRELLKSNLMLEEIVLERTKELQEANDKKDILLFQQSKMASMGEMIGNITHQWRQPISIISMWANNIIVDIDLKDIENKQLREYAVNINDQTQYLSHTIDDFRNFYIPNKNKSTFTLKSCVDKTMSLMKDLFKTHNIELIENIEYVEVTALENELTQAILNILKNAKDALLTLSHQNRKLIFIDIYKKNDRAFIEIKDNGGGIPERIIDKVFESYFTTKAKSHGTGIGLHMTGSIINKHLNGEISASNSEYKYEGVTYKGALFSINFPIESA
ncbi:sensor histidine kinase [Candidatus Sulfurimonas baltica]|uniref:histidine kinase n=1 Tax=Candidatus Sulfurimonas baltica TaxID=2740404 RepID=A0A7S7RN82_9BACT|nr:HAMP domain-containing sensor histidine kinase [Candidatus Sulfurimonas baltica]QOY52170.1 HAMP domain-containing histidine kinase [Candidatus Sulfurimonas baltica]